MAAHQAPPSLGFSRQEHWSGLPFPSPIHESESEVTQSCPTLRDPIVCSLPGSSVHGIFEARVLKSGAIAFSEFLSYIIFILPSWNTKSMVIFQKWSKQLKGMNTLYHAVHIDIILFFKGERNFQKLWNVNYFCMLMMFTGYLTVFNFIPFKSMFLYFE